MTDYQEMVEKFELSQCHKVIGMKKAESEFVIQFKNGIIQLIGLDELAIKYPTLLQSFFEERIKFTMENHDDSNEHVETNKLVFIDKNPPIRIIGCTDTGGLRFWCQFEDGESRKVMPVSIIKTSKAFQALVLQYLNNKVVDAAGNYTFGQYVCK